MSAGQSSQAATLERLVAVVEKRTGLDVSRGAGITTLERFVEGRLRELSLKSQEAYLELLLSRADDETDLLARAVTVGYTWFFRDEAQLTAIGEILRERAALVSRDLHLWVAGCSSGEDAWSLAMIANSIGVRATVLGTDLNPDVIDRARVGRYRAWSLRKLPPEMSRHLLRLSELEHQISGPLRSQVEFRVANILETPPHTPSGGHWDLILCRNLLIYFRPVRVQETVERLAGALAPGGWLALGVGEILTINVPTLQAIRYGERLMLRKADPSRERVERPARVGPAPIPLRAPSVRIPVVTAAPQPASAASRLAEGNRFLQEGRPADAATVFLEVLQENALSVEARLLAGISFHLAGESELAVDALRSALVLDPRLWPAAFYLALGYENLGRSKDAQREYRRFLETEGTPLDLVLTGSVLEDLESWRSQVVHLVRSRLRD